MDNTLIIYKDLFNRMLDISGQVRGPGSAEIVCRSGLTFILSASHTDKYMEEYENLDVSSKLSIHVSPEHSNTLTNTIAESYSGYYNANTCYNLNFNEVAELIRSQGGLDSESFINLAESYGYIKYRL